MTTHARAVELRDRLANLFAAAPIPEDWSPLHVYGHSHAIDPGVYVDGTEWFETVTSATGIDSHVSYAVGSTEIFQTAIWLNTAGGTGGVAAGAPGATWTPPGRPGAAMILTSANDIGANVKSNMPQHAANIANAHRAALAAITAASRVEQTEATFTGAWASAPSPNASGGDFRFTTEVGASAEFPVTVVDGVAYYLTYVGVGIPAAVECLVDGVVVRTITGAELAYTVADSSGGVVTAAMVAFAIPAANGDRLIKVRHAGSVGTYMFVDVMIARSPDPGPVFVCQTLEPQVGTAWGAATIAQFEANRPPIEAAVQDVVAEFPTARWVPWTAPSAESVGPDGIHLNQAGHDYQAAAIIAAFADYQGIETFPYPPIRVVTDPRSAYPPCVLIPPPLQRFDLGCGRSLVWTLIAMAPGPGNADAWLALDALVDHVAAILDIETATPASYVLPTNAEAVPAYQLTFTEAIE